MKKILLSILFLVVILASCQQSTSKPTEQLLLHSDITKVTVLTIDGDELIVFEDASSLQLFSDIISNATKENGVVKMPHPDFDIVLNYKNKQTQTLHLWLSDNAQQPINLMDENESHTVYTVPTQMTDKLNDLLYPKKNITTYHQLANR